MHHLVQTGKVEGVEGESARDYFFIRSRVSCGAYEAGTQAPSLRRLTAHVCSACSGGGCAGDVPS